MTYFVFDPYDFDSMIYLVFDPYEFDSMTYFHVTCTVVTYFVFNPYDFDSMTYFVFCPYDFDSMPCSVSCRDVIRILQRSSFAILLPLISDIAVTSVSIAFA